MSPWQSLSLPCMCRPSGWSTEHCTRYFSLGTVIWAAPVSVAPSQPPTAPPMMNAAIKPSRSAGMIHVGLVDFYGGGAAWPWGVYSVFGDEVPVVYFNDTREDDEVDVGAQVQMPCHTQSSGSAAIYLVVCATLHEDLEPARARRSLHSSGESP
ncbi:hypothetical protein Micbo1qcDRAFT_178483 [Microdochium bolleyi]|uniref:Uncharacterized protein n=1 Tax=Microdochium bolleyi TaxID=196109 RepID=A0A136IS90_9PEZI|nr:hypothetical protein Micbo1qcDRAFT_178483 [Microdochium bolleyi]